MQICSLISSYLFYQANLNCLLLITLGNSIIHHPWTVTIVNDTLTPSKVQCTNWEASAHQSQANFWCDLWMSWCWSPTTNRCCLFSKTSCCLLSQTWGNHTMKGILNQSLIPAIKMLSTASYSAHQVSEAILLTKSLIWVNSTCHSSDVYLPWDTELKTDPSQLSSLLIAPSNSNCSFQLIHRVCLLNCSSHLIADLFNNPTDTD